MSAAPGVASGGPGEPTGTAAGPGSLGEIIGDISSDFSLLVRQEVELAKAEVKESATRAGKGAGLLGGAGVAAHMVLLFLSITAWFALDGLLNSLTWSALVVTGIWAVIAAVLALVGRHQLTTISGIPRTVETAKQVPDALKGQENRS